MNIQENRIKNNCNKRKKLRTLVLSPNVNDYDTGEFPSPINNDNNCSDRKPDRMSFTNNLSHRFAYDQNKGVIFDFSQESEMTWKMLKKQMMERKIMNIIERVASYCNRKDM